MGIKTQELGSDFKMKKETTPWKNRQDFWVFIVNMIFIGVLIGMMYAVGMARDWDAPSGFVHNQTSSQFRFLPEPFIPEPGVRGRYGTGAVGRWYYWKLPPAEVTFWTRFFPWIGYSFHQIFIWGSIYYAQFKKATESLGPRRYSSKLEMFNWFAVAVNALFHLLHFINTHSTYDGLAQDVSVSSSQGSVILIFLFVLLMEYKDRGLFFGWPAPSHSTGGCSEKAVLPMGPVYLIRKYHGYVFSWGAIYTFWYHPMENTVGHALGFFYTWIIILQGSLMYTEFHLNRYWKLFIEAWVIIHGGVIAWQTGGPAMKGTSLWPMFVFGFGLVLVVTQIFSLPFWSRVPKVTYIIPLLAYTACALGTYSWVPDKEGRAWVRLPEIFRIPSTYYMYFIIAWALLFALLAIEKKYKETPNSLASTPAKRAVYLVSAMLIYVAMVGAAVMVEYLDLQQSVFVIMFLFVTIFLLGSSVSLVLLKQAVPQRWPATGHTRVEPGSSELSSERAAEDESVSNKHILSNDQISSTTTNISIVSPGVDNDSSYSNHL